MGHFEIEGICKVEKGYEGDIADFSVPNNGPIPSTPEEIDRVFENEVFNISKLVEKAIGAEVPHEFDTWCFDSNDVSSKENKESIVFYRQHFGRQYPPVYRVKFTIDAEEISFEEAEKYWKQHEWDSSKFDENGNSIKVK